MSRPRIAVTLNELPVLALGDAMAELEAAGVDEWRVEIADGAFVPWHSGSVELVEATVATSRLPVCVHLRTQQPDRFLERLATSGCKTITVQIEACRHAHRTLARIGGLGVEAGVALCASTPLTKLEYVLPLISRVTVLCTEPGARKDAVIESAYERVRILADNLRYRESRAVLEAVGGLDAVSAAKFSKFGAQVLTIGKLALPVDSSPTEAFAQFVESMAQQRHLV